MGSQLDGSNPILCGRDRMGATPFYVVATGWEQLHLYGGKSTRYKMRLEETRSQILILELAYN